MLVIAGMGIYGLRDLTLGVVECLKRADRIFVELYTSLIPDFSLEGLEQLAGKRVTVVHRNELEGVWLSKLIKLAEKEVVLLLVPGDPFIATTHAVIKLEALKRGVNVTYLPAPSIVNAIHAATGLDFYKFSRPVTIVKPRSHYFPSTPYHVLRENLSRGLHTLFLLDLDVEQGYAMSAGEAVELLREMEQRAKAGIIGGDTLFVSVARASSPSEVVKAFKLDSVPELGPPPHVLIVPGLLNPVEAEALQIIAEAPPSDIERWNARVRRLMEEGKHCVQ